MMNDWEDQLNTFHLSLADGRIMEAQAIEKLTVQEYHAYLLANKDRVEKIKDDIEKAKVKT